MKGSTRTHAREVGSVLRHARIRDAQAEASEAVIIKRDGIENVSPPGRTLRSPVCSTTSPPLRLRCHSAHAPTSQPQKHDFFHLLCPQANKGLLDAHIIVLFCPAVQKWLYQSPKYDFVVSESRSRCGWRRLRARLRKLSVASTERMEDR